MSVVIVRVSYVFWSVCSGYGDLGGLGYGSEICVYVWRFKRL